MIVSTVRYLLQKTLNALSPLCDYVHDKLPHILHLVDPLILQTVLFVQYLIWNRLPTPIDELVQSLSRNGDLAVV